MKLSKAGVRPRGHMPMIVFFSAAMGLLHVEADTATKRATKRSATIGKPMLNPIMRPDCVESYIKPSSTKKKALSMNAISVWNRIR